MSRRSWIYIIILIVVLAAGGAFFWWMYKSSKITPKAEVAPTPTFSDVPATYWAYTQIEAVNSAGYMIGYGQPTFKPGDPATREMVAIVLARAEAGSDAAVQAWTAPTTATFTDVATDRASFKYIEYLKAKDVMQGVTATEFQPTAVATREVLAAAIARSKLGGEASVQSWTPPAVATFTDVPTNYPFYKHIELVNEIGSMTGFDNNGVKTFEPTTNATRMVLAIAVAKSYNISYDNATPTFADVAKTDTGYKEVEGLTQIGWMVGYAPVGGKTFKPDDAASRATVAMVIARAVAGSDSAVPAGPATLSYLDVPPEHYAYKYIEYLKTKNIMIGSGTGTFKPDEIADRTTIAVVLARAKNLSLSAIPTSSFVDVSTTDTSFKEIEAVYKAGYTNGCRQDATGLYYCPTDQLTRAVLAAFTYNAYLKTPTPPVVSPVVSPPTPTPTVTPTPTPTPVQTSTAAPSTTTTTTTTPAKTGAEVPLAGGGVLGLLFLVRYLIGKRIK